MGVVEAQESQLGQPFEMLQPRVVDLSFRQLQVVELSQPFEVNEPSVGDLGLR